MWSWTVWYDSTDVATPYHANGVLVTANHITFGFHFFQDTAENLILAIGVAMA